MLNYEEMLLDDTDVLEWEKEDLDLEDFELEL